MSFFAPDLLRQHRHKTPISFVCPLGREIYCVGLVHTAEPIPLALPPWLSENTVQHLTAHVELE